MLQVRFSNRFELLQDALLAAPAEPRESAFVADEIIIPSADVATAPEPRLAYNDAVRGEREPVVDRPPPS